jgi:hypothetical protein
VGHTGHLRAVGHVLDIGQRQGIQVGPQGDDAIAAADVADDAVAARQEARLQPGHRQLAEDQAGGLEFVAGQFGVRVNVTSYGYELRAASGEPAVELTGQRIGPRQGLGPAGRQCATFRQRQRSTRHGSFSISIDSGTNLDKPRPRPVTLRNLIAVVVASRSVTSSQVERVLSGFSRRHWALHLSQRVTAANVTQFPVVPHHRLPFVLSDVAHLVRNQASGQLR